MWKCTVASYWYGGDGGNGNDGGAGGGLGGNGGDGVQKPRGGTRRFVPPLGWQGRSPLRLLHSNRQS